MRKKFRLLHERFGIPADSIVFEYTEPTYSLVSEDIAYTGKPHIAVSKEEGKTPFVTVPLEMLEEIKSVS